MKYWYYLDIEGNGKLNMDIDTALLQSSIDVPVLRLYRFIPCCITIGYHQKKFDPGIKNIDIVKRVTGGRAVFHNNDLTYSIISPNKYFDKGIYGSYKQIADSLISSLSYYNDELQCKKRPDKNYIKNDSCFAAVSYYEIEFNNRKIIGSAQRRIKNRFLQHGSIMIDINYKEQAKVFKVSEDIIKDQMIGLTEISTKKIDIEDICKRIKKSFENNFNIKLKKINKEDIL